MVRLLYHSFVTLRDLTFIIGGGMGLQKLSEVWRVVYEKFCTPIGGSMKIPRWSQCRTVDATKKIMKLKGGL